MRWSIIRLIWLRELRDQLRDRRTMFVMVVLPLLIYPLGGLGLMQITLGSSRKTSNIGILGREHLPPAPGEIPLSQVRSLGAWFSLAAGGVDPLLGSCALASTGLNLKDYPSLVVRDGSRLAFPPEYVFPPTTTAELSVEEVHLPQGVDDPRSLLNQGGVDLLLIVPPGFSSQLERGEVPPLLVMSRQDDRSRLALARTLGVLTRWRDAVKEVRFSRVGLPPRFDTPINLVDPDLASRPIPKPMEQIFDLLTRTFPFVLVLWSLAGALYPAVDLCAGEKERGTMETLLISPAQREEIVWGKFLTIWVFSAVTALLNLVSMVLTSWAFSHKLGVGSLNLGALMWSVILLLPLSAFFSALCLSVGAYARSTKEGQYYLMPLFVITMPLVFLTLAPGVELNPFYSMVPVTGVSLLLQKLIQVGTPDPALWLYFVPVLVPMIIYSWLALRWAIIQFQREEVLFREADRVEVRLWLRRLLRDREPRPSAGQALFCFVVVLALSWFSLGFGSELLSTNIIRFLAFVGAPTLLMAFLLTTQPRQSLAVRMPPSWTWPAALALVVLLTPPLAQLGLLMSPRSPDLEKQIAQYSPFAEWLKTVGQHAPADLRWLQALIVFAFLPAVFEELTFRGFILTGLQRRFRPRTAVLITSFLFCVMQMNVFLFVPTFILGVVLGYLATRCGSILPSMLFSVLHRTLLMAPALIHPERKDHLLSLGLEDRPRLILVAICTPLAALLLWWLTKHRPHSAYVAFLHSDPGMELPPVEE